MAVKSKETTALLEDIDSSLSAICSKQDYIEYQYVQKQDIKQRKCPSFCLSYKPNRCDSVQFDPGLPGREAASVDKWFPTFRRHMSPFIQPFKIHEE
jgi:hypothetical protein